MHLALELTVQGEPLAAKEKDDLAAAIVNAPAWKQLHLRASVQAQRLNDEANGDDHNQIRINIDHLRTNDEPSSKQHHRIGVNVPFADIIPPDGVPVVRLLSVKLELALLRSKRKSTCKRQKTDRGNASKSDFNQQGADDDTYTTPSDTARPHALKRPVLEVPQSELSESQIEPERPPEVVGTLQISPGTEAERAKVVIPQCNMEASEILAELLSARGEKRKLPGKEAANTIRGSGPGLQRRHDKLSKLIDGAIKLSVCSGAVKLPHDIKVVTGTFSASLSEICPAVWRLQHLPAMSQRAHLLPTISRSLCRIWPKAKSLTLRSKFDCLAATDIAELLDLPEPRETDARVIAAVHSQLWLHVQRKLRERPIKHYASFCPLASSFETATKSDELLDKGLIGVEAEKLNVTGDGSPASNNPKHKDAGTEKDKSSAAESHFLRNHTLENNINVVDDPASVKDDLIIEELSEEVFPDNLLSDVPSCLGYGNELLEHQSEPDFDLNTLDNAQNPPAQPSKFPDLPGITTASEETLFEEPSEHAHIMGPPLDESDTSSAMGDPISVY